ncbi:MAG: mechanosensitive ion channel domain-containing protein [Halieaceae bacterium]
MPENIDIQALMNDYVMPWGINIAMAVIIFIIGRMVVGMVVNLCKKLMLRASMDEMLVGFVGSILRWVLLLFVIVAALDQLGVNTTSLVALLGAAGLAIGLSLQSSLGNFAAGVMLIVFRPFQKGDFVEIAGTAGVVQQIGIFTSTLATPDNKEIIVPNGAIYNGSITNFSARDTRRVDMVFGIGYGDDIKRAKQVLTEIISADERVLKDPEPVIALGSLGESSVDFLVRPWVNSADYWAVMWDTNEKVKERFDAEGISIPFPQMDLHIDSDADKD